MSTAYNASSLEDGISALGKGAKKISFQACQPKLGEEGCAELCRSLKKHDDVHWLGLFDQELTPYALDGLLHNLKPNKNLVHLDLGRNQLGDEGVLKICDFLTGNKSISEVFLWDNKITNEGAKHIENMLMKNRSIQILDLNDNPEISQDMKSRIAALLKQGSSRVPTSPRLGPAKIGGQ